MVTPTDVIHVQVKKSSQRLTIYEKMEILAYAKQVTEEYRRSAKELKRKGKRSTKAKKQRQFVKGLNVQRLCEVKFQGKLNRIKICQLKAAAEAQKWHLLTEQQQRTSYQLSDTMKLVWA